MNDDTDDERPAQPPDVSETDASGSKAPREDAAQTSVAEPLEDRIAAADRRKAEFLDTCRYNLEISQLYQSESRQLEDAKVIAFYQGIAECAAGRIPHHRLKAVRDYFDHASRLVRGWRKGNAGVTGTEFAQTQPPEFVLAQHAIYNLAVIHHRSGEFETAIERYTDVENACRPYQFKQTDLTEIYPLSGVLLAATFGRILAKFDQFRVQAQTPEGIRANSEATLLGGPSLFREADEFLDYVLRVQAAWRRRSTGPSPSPSDARWFDGILRWGRNATPDSAPSEALPRPSGEKDAISFSSLHTLALMARQVRRVIESLAPNQA